MDTDCFVALVLLSTINLTLLPLLLTVVAVICSSIENRRKHADEALRWTMDAQAALDPPYELISASAFSLYSTRISVDDPRLTDARSFMGFA